MMTPSKPTLELNIVPRNAQQQKFISSSSPQIGYYYRASPAKDFGKGFNKYFEHTLLVVADPVQGCSEFVNTHKIPGNFILVERGECSFVEKVC